MAWRPFVINDVVNHEKYVDRDGVLVFAMYKAPNVGGRVEGTQTRH